MCIVPNSACACHDCAQALADFIAYLHEPIPPWTPPKPRPSLVAMAMPDRTDVAQLRLPVDKR